MEKHKNPTEGCTLFVSRISPTVQEPDLLKYFSQFGVVEEIDLSHFKNKFTPKTAQIKFTEKSASANALRVTRHHLENGTKIKVEPLLEGPALIKKIEEEKRRKVSVFGIYGHPTRKEFEKAFWEFGRVDFCYFSHYDDRPYKAHGFVIFVTEEAARKAIAKGTTKVNKKKVRIKEFDNKFYENQGEKKKEYQYYPGQHTFYRQQPHNFLNHLEPVRGISRDVGVQPLSGFGDNKGEGSEYKYRQVDQAISTKKHDLPSQKMNPLTLDPVLNYHDNHIRSQFKTSGFNNQGYQNVDYAQSLSRLIEPNNQLIDSNDRQSFSYRDANALQKIEDSKDFSGDSFSSKRDKGLGSSEIGDKDRKKKRKRRRKKKKKKKAAKYGNEISEIDDEGVRDLEAEPVVVFSKERRGIKSRPPDQIEYHQSALKAVIANIWKLDCSIQNLRIYRPSLEKILEEGFYF